MSNDYFNPPNSVWPNGLKRDEEGYVIFYPLGTNKVDISTITWPEGDKLVSPFVYQNDKLVGFVDTKALTVSGSATTTMNYNHIEADFASISEGTLTVNAPNAAVKKFTWAVSTSGNETFDFVIIDFNTADQETIDTVRTAYEVVDKTMYDVDGNVIGTWDTSKLEVAGIYDEEAMKLDGLFCNMDVIAMEERGLILSGFNSDLSSLRDGNLMFAACYRLEIFNSDLSNLTNGSGMFDSCGSLASFSTNLHNLTTGDFMFNACHYLTSFNSDLSSLTKGDSMFNYCKLDAPSIKNIIDTINSISQRSVLGLGIGCNDTPEDANRFAQEVGEYADMESLLSVIRSKGWIVEAQYNGRPDTTYSLRKPSEDTLPVFVKLEETEEHADYTSEDGSKKFRLNWFHETTGSTEGYTQFNSLEEAVAHYNIKPIERN